MRLNRIIPLLGLIGLAENRPPPLRDSSFVFGCSNPTSKWVFLLSSADKDANLFNDLIKSTKSAIMKKSIYGSVEVTVDQEDSKKFLKKTKHLNIYRSHRCFKSLAARGEEKSRVRRDSKKKSPIRTKSVFRDSSCGCWKNSATESESKLMGNKIWNSLSLENGKKVDTKKRNSVTGRQKMMRKKWNSRGPEKIAGKNGIFRATSEKSWLKYLSSRRQRKNDETLRGNRKNVGNSSLINIVEKEKVHVPDVFEKMVAREKRDCGRGSRFECGYGGSSRREIRSNWPDSKQHFGPYKVGCHVIRITNFCGKEEEGKVSISVNGESEISPEVDEATDIYDLPAEENPKPEVPLYPDSPSGELANVAGIDSIQVPDKSLDIDQPEILEGSPQGEKDMRGIPKKGPNVVSGEKSQSPLMEKNLQQTMVPPSPDINNHDLKTVDSSLTKFERWKTKPEVLVTGKPQAGPLKPTDLASFDYEEEDEDEYAEEEEEEESDFDTYELEDEIVQPSVPTFTQSSQDTIRTNGTNDENDYDVDDDYDYYNFRDYDTNDEEDDDDDDDDDDYDFID